jgi:hypothetical protein
MPQPTRRTLVTRGQQQQAEAPPSTAGAPERRLVLALLARALLDACALPQARDWLATDAFDAWCALIDLPADRLRQAVATDPERVRRYARMLGHG